MRCGVGKNRVDRVAAARADPHDFLPVRPPLEQDLLDRQDLARLATLGLSRSWRPPPDAEQPADEDTQTEERTGDQDPQQLRPEAGVQEHVHIRLPFMIGRDRP